MSKNEKKHPQGYWIAVGTRRIAEGQTIAVDGSAGMITLHAE